MAQLIAKARDIGVEPADYALKLIRDALAMQREAKAMTFAQIMDPVRKTSGAVEEGEIVKLVDKARDDYYGCTSRRKMR